MGVYLSKESNGRNERNHNSREPKPKLIAHTRRTRLRVIRTRRARRLATSTVRLRRRHPAARRGRSARRGREASKHSRARSRAAVRASRGPSDVSDLPNRAERLRGLGVGHHLSVRGVSTWEILRIALALLEDTVLGVRGAVEVDTDTVKDVFAVVTVVGVAPVAKLEAEAVATDEVVPLNNLNGGTSERVRVHDTSHGVTTAISTMRVHLSSPVISENVDLGLVNEANDLDIVGRLCELESSQRASGEETSAMARLGAPGDHDTLDIADLTTHIGRTPEAEVIESIEVRSLAERVLVLRRRVTDIVAMLRTTGKVVSVDLVWNSIRIRKRSLLR